MNKQTFKLEDRRAIGGVKNNLMQIRPTKHTWAVPLLLKMKDNTWDEREVDLTEDAKLYSIGGLEGGNLTAYKRALAFLSNLDGIQLNNLTHNIGRHITSPEISMCIVRQGWEEAQHVLSYAQMIESIGFDPKEIYWMFDTDPILAEKNAYITRSSEILGSGYSPSNFIKAVIANIALEGIYFFNGFLIFYSLEKQGVMRGSAKMIQLIQRDEEIHLTLFINLWNTLKVENPDEFTPELLSECRELLHLAAQHEIVWGKYMIQEGVMGLTPTIIQGFIESLTDLRCSAIGLEPLYGTKNPIPWFWEASSINNGETNFFEGKNASYSTGNLEWE